MEDFNLDEFKKMVDNIFKDMPKEFKETLSISANMEGFAVEKALEELEVVRSAFVAFQNEVNGLVVYGYLVNQVEQFAVYAESLLELIENRVEEDKLNPDMLRKYKGLQNFRAQVLSKIINKYKKEDK